MSSKAAESTASPEQGIFVFFSDYLNRPVVDSDHRPVGRVWDMGIRLEGPFPTIDQVLLQPDRSEVILIADGRQIASWLDVPVRLSVRLSELRPSRRHDSAELLLRESLLDKQVVDVSGAKVERVNDLSLLIVRDNEMRLAHIDVGLRGLVRRLGWEKAVDGIVRLMRPGAGYLSAERLIGWKYVVHTVGDPAGLRLALSQRSLAKLHPADLAEILEDLPADSRRTMFESLELDTAARVLSEVDPEVQEDLLAHETNPEKAADLLETMAPDAAADVLAELPEEDAEKLISRMQPEEAEAVTTLLHHEENTAGALMTTDFIAMPATLTVSEAFARLRVAARDVEFLYQFYIVDEKNGLLGYVTMRRLFLASPEDRLDAIMAPWSILVHQDDSTSEVAGVIERYNLAAVPVVDKAGVIKGMITVDDVLTEELPSAWKRKLRL